MSNILVRIDAPHFLGGVEVSQTDKLVVKTAPIMKYMLGWNLQKVFEYAEKKKWRASIVI